MSDDNAGLRRPPLHIAQHLARAPTSAPHRDNLAASLDVATTPDAMTDAGYQFTDYKIPYDLADQALLAPPIDSSQANAFLPAQSIASAAGSAPPPHVLSPVVPIPELLPSDLQNLVVDAASEPNREREASASTSNNVFLDPSTGEFGLSMQGQADMADAADNAMEGRDAAAPAWSELKTKAGKDRKRLPLACIACRRKKIRCSGEKPACKHCMRSRIPCVYKVTTRKAAPRTDYMAMLDKRLKRMEERIIKILPKSEQSSIAAIPRAVLKPAMPSAGAAASSKPAFRKRNADEAFGPNLEAWARAPQPQSADEEPSTPDSQKAEENRLLKEGIESLPSKEIQEHLAEVYFDNLYGQPYHLLHKPSYMRKLRNGTLPPVLVLAVCGIAARFATNPKLTSTSTSKQFLRGEEWASVARDICIKRYDWPNITILTCLLILGMHGFGTCHGARAWALGGQAIRMAFALQLHKDLEYDPSVRDKNRKKLSFIDREIRRRTMWACVVMDRFNSSSTDRPIFIREETVKIPLPVSEKYFQLDMPVQTEFLDGSLPKHEGPEETCIENIKDSMGVAAYTIRSLTLWARIITYVNQGGKDADTHPMWSSESNFDKLVREVETLLRTLPECVRYSRKNLEIHRTEKLAGHLLFLHITIQQSLLFLNQAAITFSPDRFHQRVPKDFILRANAKTFFAANRISDLFRDAEEIQCNVSTPFAGYCAFSSTAIHISGLFSGNPALKANSEANSGVNVRFLRKMMKHWGMFHWMVENIRTQYRNALDAAKAGGLPQGSTGASPVLQHSDWFDQYPHGVLDPDYMDPVVYRKKEKGEDGALEQKPELQPVGDFFATVGPASTFEGRDGSRGPAPKRKALKKTANQAVANSRAAPKPSDEQRQSPAESGGLSLASHGGSQLQLQAQQPQVLQLGSPQSQRALSEMSGGQSMAGDTSSPSTFSVNNVPLTQGALQGIPQPPALNFEQFSPFGQPILSQAGFFSTDMLSMNLGQPPDSLLQSLDKQFAYSGFAMDADNMAGAAGSYGGWNDLPPTQQARSAGPLQPQPGRDMSTQGQFGDTMGQFNPIQEIPSAWYMPFGSQEVTMGGSDVGGYGNVFGAPGGLTPINQSGDAEVKAPL